MATGKGEVGFDMVSGLRHTQLTLRVVLSSVTCWSLTSTNDPIHIDRPSQVLEAFLNFCSVSRPFPLETDFDVPRSCSISPTSSIAVA